ncbi:MAG: tRNA 2-thiocytidine(32) synthetase TtcA, partial [Pseudobdellovibrionaceae bacterium]
MSKPIDFQHPLAIKIRKQIVQALNDFDMIQDGDKIAVAVSGGKDSSILVALLNEIRKRSERKFTVEALILDQKQPGFDITAFNAWIESLDIKLHILQKDTYSIVKEKTPEGSIYCTLCAKFRRAILYDFTHANGFTKMALGHHRDDLIETTLLNMFYIGQMGTMAPKLKSDDGRNIVVRPLAYVAEKDLQQLAADWGFPIIPCNLCGSQETLKRKKMKKLIQELEKDIPHIGSSIITALSNINPSQLLDQKLWDFKKVSHHEV